MDLILAIDDDQNILKTVEAQLTEIGYRVITAASPDQGIHLAASGSPSLILLDIMMPRKDGFSVLKELQSDGITAQIPVIMLSSKKDKETVVNAMKQGVADYMVKPCTIDMLKKKVDTALKYNRMQRDIEAEERSEHIKISRGQGRTVLSFITSLSDRRLMDDLRTIFNKGFLTITAHTIMVLDLRPLDSISPNDIPLLKAVFTLLKGRMIHVITGKHYGSLVEHFDEGENIKMYISPGDMEMELKM